MTLLALQPVDITDSMILSSDAVETHPEWTSGAVFAKGERCIIQSQLSEYESLVDGNQGHDPLTSLGTYWVRSGPSNKGAMFDKSVTTRTTGEGPFSVEVAPGRAFNAVGFVNMQGSKVRLIVRDSVGGSIVYDRTAPLTTRSVFSWFQYFFTPFDDVRTEVVFRGIPQYPTAVAEVIVDGANVGIGAMILGTTHEMGVVLYDASFGITDYSQLEEDQWGNVSLADSDTAYARNMDLQVVVNKNRVAYVSRLLAQLRRTPTLWIGSEDPDYPLIVFGFVRSWRGVIRYPNESLIDLQIRGMNDVI